MQNKSENNVTLKNPKKTITPFEKLKKRITSQFQKKKFIGDIPITDQEYEMLIDYFKTRCKALISSKKSIANDPIFAIALVQIGIKFYDGNYWSHVSKILGTEKINPVDQCLIGKTFINTLAAHNKIMLNKNERVNNILMHGIVSDYYANELLDFLFKYYNIDLERDLQRNNTEMMNNLIEVTQRSDNTGRTYLLVKQTANAIGINIRGAKIRIRYLLKLIDKCFWEQISPENSGSRFAKLFIKWQENSEDFKVQYNKYHNLLGGGKKNYASPYLSCGFKETNFKLVLPTQLIKMDHQSDLQWNIYFNGKHLKDNAVSYQAVTGYKTEELKVTIDKEDIFNDFLIELTCNEKRLKLFKIKASCIRFFDRDGDYLNIDSSLPKGEVYAFTPENETIRSEALIENELVNGLVRWFFEFEEGDIIRLPDGKTIAIGKKPEEGLLLRKTLNGARVIYNGNKIPIYYAPPSILLKLLPNRATGTVLDIDGIRYRLFDKETTVINLDDGSGEMGYIVNLGDYGCTHDNIYTVLVDVPNDRTNRYWQFALINSISFQFEDAPYIFKSKGTISFNEELDIYPSDSLVEKNNDENSYNFEIKHDVDYLQFKYKTPKNLEINFEFYIPALKWRFDKGQWNLQRPQDIWHSDFPAFIYIKYHENRIKLSLDETQEDFDNRYEQGITYAKSKSKDMFECDTTRFKSWFGREKVIRRIYIDLPKNKIEFIKVITQSTINNHIFKTDYASGELIGELDITGNSNYFVDVIRVDTKELLAEKTPVIDGKFIVESRFASGIYQIRVFEDEEDETGFGASYYLPIGRFELQLINPYNLEGKSLSIKQIKKHESIFQVQLSRKYIIYDLKRHEDTDKNNYTGQLLIKNMSGYSLIANNVKIEFMNLNKLHLTYISYYDGYDYVEFLYDTSLNQIVKEEEKGLKRAVRYRRYDSLFPEDYVYIVEFTDESPIINEANLQSNPVNYNDIKKTSRKITIEEMGLSVKAYNCLKRAGIYTAEEINKRSIKDLQRIRNMGRSSLEEVVFKMQELGFTIKGLDIKDKETSKPSNTNSSKPNQEEVQTQKQVSVNRTPVMTKNINVEVEEIENTDPLDTPLSEIGLSMMVLNCLKKANVLTVRNAVERGTKRLTGIHGFNKKMCKELIDKLYCFGVSIR